MREVVGLIERCQEATVLLVSIVRIRELGGRRWRRRVN